MPAETSAATLTVSSLPAPSAEVQGYKYGRINDDGDWQPTALNPSTGEWQDIKPGDVVIQGGSVTQVEDGTFTQTDEQRTGNLFNPTPDSDR